jgi:hypothetical protein
MRVTNIDTLSAYLDRLITERIKWYFFKKDGLEDKVKHQEEVITDIKDKMNGLFWECFHNKGYDYRSEQRTFNEDAIVEELEELIINDINIGESDRARLEEVQSIKPNLETMIRNEKRLRKANEGRSRNKNKIDKHLKDGIG